MNLIKRIAHVTTVTFAEVVLDTRQGQDHAQ